MIPRLLAFAGIACVMTGCFTSAVDGIGGPGGNGPSPECDEDSDCAHLDKDNDVCTRARCSGGRCERELVRGTSECQCHADSDCKFFEADCSTGTCALATHQCSEKITPAGPAREAVQKAGDCMRKTCDGVARAANEVTDDTDLPPDDDNECTTETCGPNGPVITTKTCGIGEVCFKGQCLACKAQNPTSCGGEGPGEPANDDPTTPFMMSEYTPFCAYGSGSDVDWYRFYAKDDDFEYDLMKFRFWSNAPNIEVCAYAKCDNGRLPDGCSGLVDGPNGARGCCWTGAPATLKPSWDMDCPNTTSDSATVWVSVKMPGAAACEPYAMWGGY